jgi:hypothetical protein
MESFLREIQENQGYTQDGNNYYVWYTTHFSTHEVSIVFSAKSQNLDFTVWGVLLVAVSVIPAIAFIIVLRRWGKTKAESTKTGKQSNGSSSNC